MSSDPASGLSPSPTGTAGSYRYSEAPPLWAALPPSERSLAILHDALSANADFSRVWRDLCSGRHRFREVFHSEQRCYALLERFAEAPHDAGPVDDRQREILERVLIGQPQKAIAIELDVAPSTVAAALARRLRQMGSRCRGSNPPILMVMAAHAARGLGAVVGARLGQLRLDGRETWVLSAPRPDLHLCAGLSNAETTILRKLVEGETLAEIARSRRTTARTISNQLAAVFRKLGVSGRGALLAELVVRACTRTELS